MMIYFLVSILIWSNPACSGSVDGMSPSSIAVQHSNEQIDHAHFLVNDIGSLYLNGSFSDVVLLVGEERLPVHRVVLASRSEYFSALLYGSLNESQQSEVKINVDSVTSFKILLEYIYTGRINLSILENELIFELFQISDMFGFQILKPPLSKYLLSNVNVHNACSLFAAARLHQHKELVDESITFIDNHASVVLQSDGFVFLSTEALQEILIRDSFYANELDIFRAVCRWINENEKYLDSDTKMKVLSTVRYPLMSDEELLEVRETQLVRSDTISDAIQFRNTSLPHNLPFRGQLKPNVNLFDNTQPFLVNNDVDANYMIKLDHPSVINHIRMMFYDNDELYYIEVSMDMNDWVRVIDHSNYICRSVQRLWIYPRVVWYIRIVGTRFSADMTCHFFEVSYNTERRHLLKIKKGLVSPKFNVAVLSMNAILINGTNRHDRYSLLDGNYNNYNEGLLRYFRYTFHILGSGYILVQLAQPYMLSSMRILLWDGDDRVYGYTIEVSANCRKWKMIVDKSKEATRSWQVLKFKPRPTVFIRITGVYSSSGDDFRCVHLEAPAQVTLDSNVGEDDLEVTNYRDNSETDITMADTSAPVD